MLDIDWTCKSTWRKSSYNTMWCLIGCSIGDFGTIYFFQSIDHSLSIYLVMLLAIINGIITSIILETIILAKQFPIFEALNIAIKMSLISMIAMELAMNFTDIFLEGALILSFSSLIPVLVVGFIVPWPYNYWRLVKYNKNCCG